MTASRWCARRCRCDSKPDYTKPVITCANATAFVTVRTQRRSSLYERNCARRRAPIRPAPLAPSGLRIARNLALVRSPHHLHGVLDMTPLPGFLGVALALA